MNTNSYGPKTEAADSLHAMKYRSPGEDFREAMNRVAFGLKDSDEHYHALRLILLDQRFCPGGRVQGAIGASRATTAYNCVGGETKVLTRDYGLVPLASLTDQIVKVLDGKGDWTSAIIRDFGEQALHEVSFTNGRKHLSIRATIDHGWIKDGERITTRDLKKNDRIDFLKRDIDYENSTNYARGVVHGFVYGDGTKVSDNFGFHLRLCKPKEAAMLSFLTAYPYSTPPSCEGDRVYYFYGDNAWTDFKVLPSVENSEEYILGFLRGWFCADGCVSEQPEVLFTMGDSERRWLEQFGPIANFYPTGYSYLGSETNYGTRTKTLNNVRLDRRFLSSEDFLRKDHRNRYISDKQKSWRVSYVSKEPVATETVYCAVVNTTNSFALASGLHSGNCFVSGTIADSFVEGHDSIMGRAKDAAATMRMGGGIGYDFSTLRPRGDIIRKLQSQSSGPISFMRIFNEVCLATASSGHRRGAQMGVLRVDHPDVEEFVRSKQNATQLTGFNISLAITDAFMDAVASGSEFDLTFGGSVYQTVDARELWEKIMRSTWDYAEPGVIFIDTINRLNNLWYCETIAATNPCFTVDTRVHTPFGPRTFGELVASGVKSIPVLTQLPSGALAFRDMKNPRITQRMAKLVKVHLRGSGRKRDTVTTLRCTPNHTFYLSDGREVQAKNLQFGDSIYSFYRHKANDKGYMRLNGKLDEVLEHIASAEYKYGYRPKYPEEHAHHIDDNKSNNDPENIEILSGVEHNAMNMREKNASGVMRHNTYTGNPGEANGRYRSDITTEALKAMRESGLSYAAISKAVGVSKYMVMQRLGWTRNHTVEKVEVLDYCEDVYCGTVVETGKFFAVLGDGNEGVLVSNCGEQPLPPFGACLLGSFNLTKYLRIHPVPVGDVPYYFDWDQLQDDIPHVVRGMDNVVDRTRYPLAEQKAEALAKRRMGLGVMGLANAGEALGFPYGTAGFIDFQRRVLELINNQAYIASAMLAKEKGAFPLFDTERYLEGAFIKRLPHDVRHLIQQHGIRNSHLTSIAPTGTISLCADNTSGGIEPVFSYELTRQINTPKGPTLATVQDYGVAYLNTRGKLAADVSADEHIRVLATAQYYVDSAVSKTINMTGKMPWEDFKRVYESAWVSGCKGCATFNSDGKRMALLVAKPDAEQETEGLMCLAPDPTTGQRECG